VIENDPLALIASKLVREIEVDLGHDALELIALVRSDVAPGVAQLLTNHPAYRRIILDRSGDYTVIVGLPCATDAKSSNRYQAGPTALAPGQPDEEPSSSRAEPGPGDDADDPDGLSGESEPPLPLVTRASKPPGAPSNACAAPSPALDDDPPQSADSIRVEEHDLVEG
jgi:hypothetical protein